MGVPASAGDFPNAIIIIGVFAIMALVAWALVTIVMVGVFAGVATFVRRLLSRDQGVEPWGPDSN